MSKKKARSRADRLKYIVDILKDSYESLELKELEFLAELAWKIVRLRKGDIMSPDVKWTILEFNSSRMSGHAPMKVTLKCPKGLCHFSQRTGYCSNPEPDIRKEDRNGEQVMWDSENRGAVICCHTFVDARDAAKKVTLF